MLGRLVNDALVEKASEYPWGDTLALLLRADARICNLECAISDDGTPWSATPKEFHFRSDSKNVRTLLAAGVSLVSLANNHALDFGYQGLADTIDVLDRSGIRHAGAGSSLREAEKVATLEVRGTKVGVVAFTDNEPGWEAASDRPGTFYVPVEIEDPRAMRLRDLVSKAKRDVDIMVVSAHWGPNWGYAPPTGHVRFAHALVDAGADVVFGHSGHVFRGVEVYKDRPILYCTGDFIDDYAVDFVERNDESFAFVLEVDRGSASRLRLYPTTIKACQAGRARGFRGRAIAEKMQGLCRGFGTEIRWEEEPGCLDIALARAEK